MEFIKIIIRVLAALCSLGFIFGAVFWEKNEVFKRIGLYTGSITMIYGAIMMLIFAVLGI